MLIPILILKKKKVHTIKVCSMRFLPSLPMTTRPVRDKGRSIGGEAANASSLLRDQPCHSERNAVE